MGRAKNPTRCHPFAISPSRHPTRAPHRHPLQLHDRCPLQLQRLSRTSSTQRPSRAVPAQSAQTLAAQPRIDSCLGSLPERTYCSTLSLSSLKISAWPPLFSPHQIGIGAYSLHHCGGKDFDLVGGLQGGGQHLVDHREEEICVVSRKIVANLLGRALKFGLLNR